MLKFKKNVLLKNHTAFKIGGPAKYFFTAKTKDDVINAINWAESENLLFFILGGGSNILAADKGYEGLVIKVQSSKLKIQSEKLKCKIYVEAGMSLAILVNKTLKNGLTGLEGAAGIPGTVGGAIAGNAGAFGKAMADAVKNVEVLEIQDKKVQSAPPVGGWRTKSKIRILKNRECKFGYRDSVFKHNKNLIILSAVLELKKGNKKEIQKKAKEFLRHRIKNQPTDYPSAGSVFKNPQGFFAGELIEKCGLKGKKIGKAMISEKHSNFIVNLGKAKAKDVLALINLAKLEVKNKFGIEMEDEIQFIRN